MHTFPSRGHTTIFYIERMVTVWELLERKHHSCKAVRAEVRAGSPGSPARHPNSPVRWKMKQKLEGSCSGGGTVAEAPHRVKGDSPFSWEDQTLLWVPSFWSELVSKFR